MLFLFRVTPRSAKIAPTKCTRGESVVFEGFKEPLAEITELANSCPEKYQQKCFEILLQMLVTGQGKSSVQAVAQPITAAIVNSPDQVGQLPRALQQAGVNQANIDRVFHRDGKTCKVIVQDLRAKPVSQRQERLALLLGIKSLIEIGEAAIPKDDLVALCKEYSAFDSSNFAAHMKKRKQSFVGKPNGWALTVPGIQEAARLIDELAS